MTATNVLQDVRYAVAVDWQDDFRQFLARRRSQNTVAAYVRDVALFAAWFERENGQPFSPSLLTGVDLRSYAKTCMETQRPATWNRKRAALSVLCGWALQEGYVSYQPFQDIPRAEETPLPPRWLEDNDLRRLMRYLEQQANHPNPGRPYARRTAVRDRAIVMMMLYAGLRVAEVVSLALADAVMTERKGRVIVRRGKGGKRREAPMCNELRRAVQAWIDLRGHEAGFLFTGKNGGGLSTRQVQRMVRELGYQVRIDNLTPHALRHTFAKRLVRSGVDLKTVSRLMGHSRLETTGRYVEPGWADYESAVETL